jgi:hypothetical protein
LDYDYANQDKWDYYFNNEDINTDEDYDSLEVDSPSPFSTYYEHNIKVFYFYNIIPKSEIKNIETENDVLKMDKNFEWITVKPIPRRLTMGNKLQSQWLHRIQNQTNEKQQHLLSLHFPEFNPTQHEDG